MDTSFDVRIWKVEVYEGKRTTSYYVRWTVAGRTFKEPFKHPKQADNFKSQLSLAASKGEAFYVDTGRPVSMQRTANDSDWFSFACEFADLRWKRQAATTRRTRAEALAKVTIALLRDSRSRPEAALLRHVLNRWAFNPLFREHPQMPIEVRDTLRWLARNTVNVSELAKPDMIRKVQDALTTKLDGGRSALSVSSRHRSIFNASLYYAVERKMLTTNPLTGFKEWKASKGTKPIDQRYVPNPIQVRTLFNAVLEVRGGDRLVAFFGCLYYGLMRPEEAVSLHDYSLALPAKGWGEIHLDGAEPFAGAEWTDSGSNRDKRQLKQREVGTKRPVPCPPELTALLHQHIERFGLGEGGRIFVGERNKKELPKGTINRVYRDARRLAFTPEVCATPLAKDPYDLRDAGISLCLAAGVPPTDVAAWAGQSVEILYAVYAAWLAGRKHMWQKRIQEQLEGGSL